MPSGVSVLDLGVAGRQAHIGATSILVQARKAVLQGGVTCEGALPRMLEARPSKEKISVYLART